MEIIDLTAAREFAQAGADLHPESFDTWPRR